ncbi:MAG: hypothetical protein R3C59_00025 [Planctomycetaceae bacterium]
MQFLLPLAMRVQLFRELPDTGLLMICGSGKWKGLKTPEVLIPRVITYSESSARCHGPYDVRAAGKASGHFEHTVIFVLGYDPLSKFGKI